MTETLTVIQSVAIDSGPSISKTTNINLEAYDVVDVVAHKSSVPAIILVHPSELDQMNMILVTSDNYTSLTYVVDGGSPITLDGPQLFLGKGQIGLLGATSNMWTFTNAGSTLDANIKIIVGRAAED
jgi:hypothetical protein